ncbi:TRAP transporter substrate-binding protein [Maritalea porphyrae]|uniref:TRAP transporter substrate-binding protein n=1 Tax=Maritalea porphyrae TaxID=880732 RepID=UPI0022B059CB|nr:TRAP transporter substrate-binding protein [Maritalea porphyrae]MCZ4273407.1 TRAP transporter substrate-binding protein [Maritalea porphyrae]
MKNLVIAAAMSAICLTGTAIAEPVKLKMGSSFPSSQPLLGTSGVDFAKTVTAITGGDVQVKFYEPGALVPAFEILDAVGSGTIDAGWANPGYHTKNDIAFALFSAVPFGPRASEYAAWMFYGGGSEMLNEKLYSKFNVHSEICGVSPPETAGWFRKEINNLDELKGMKMRFFGLGARVMQKLGVDTQLLPGGDIYPALERGTIDATEYSMPAVDENAGFYQLAKYNYFPGWHQQSTLQDFIINLDIWNGMSDGQRLAIRTACRASFTNMLAEGEAINGAALTRLQNDHGVNIRQWSDEQLAVFEENWAVVAEELQKESATFAEAWSALQEFRSEYNVWKSNAYLK